MLVSSEIPKVLFYGAFENPILGLAILRPQILAQIWYPIYALCCLAVLTTTHTNSHSFSQAK